MISLHNMLPFELTKDTPYLALSGELWSVFYEYFNRNWPCYKEFLLYIQDKQRYVITRHPQLVLSKTAVDARAWRSKYIPYMVPVEIRYPNLDLY